MNNLLIVDDNVALSDSVHQIFDHVGYHVRAAYDGIDGWQQIKADTPDIILADISMPGMDGFQLLQNIRNHTPTETTPFIFVTARTQRELWRRGMESGSWVWI